MIDGMIIFDLVTKGCVIAVLIMLLIRVRSLERAMVTLIEREADK